MAGSLRTSGIRCASSSRPAARGRTATVELTVDVDLRPIVGHAGERDTAAPKERYGRDAELSEHWDQLVEAWARRARAPGHDAYWDFSGPRLRELLPSPGRRTLDLGCGEGRLARDLSAGGHRVVGVDASPTAIRLAVEADPDGTYVRADAAALPFDGGSFDLAVALNSPQEWPGGPAASLARSTEPKATLTEANSLMDIKDLEGALRETARVLEPDGRLCA